MKERSAKSVVCLAALQISCSASESVLQHVLTGAEPAQHAQVFAAERDGAIEKPDQSGGFKEREMNMFSEKSGDPRWKLVRKGTAPAFAPQNMRSVEPCCLLQCAATMLRACASLLQLQQELLQCEPTQLKAMRLVLAAALHAWP